MTRGSISPAADGAVRFGAAAELVDGPVGGVAEILEAHDDALLLGSEAGEVELAHEEVDGVEDAAELQPVAPHLAEHVLLDVGVLGVPVDRDEVLEPARHRLVVPVPQEVRERGEPHVEQVAGCIERHVRDLQVKYRYAIEIRVNGT